MTSPEEMFNPITKPKHYVSDSGMEAIDVIEAFAKDNAHRAAALKYLLRAGKKSDTVEDLRKAIWWIEREITYRSPNSPVMKPRLVLDDNPNYAKYEKPVALDFTHCEGCHSRVCETVGACMHKVDCPH